ncbi:MAG: LPS assembly lipoprotein LptE [Candidatus Methylomirabilales bacterium]
MNKKLTTIGLLLLAVMVWSCGYRGQVGLPDDLKRIHLDISNTGTSRPGMEAEVRHALTRGILSAGGQVVVEKSQADATIKGTITSLKENPVAFDAQDIAQRFRVVVVLDFEVIQRNGEAEVPRGQVQGEAYYSAPTGITGTEVAANDAIRRALRDLADKVVARVAEPFF